MNVIMTGKEVAASMKLQLTETRKELQKQGINPCLGIIRIGERPDDLAYEKGAIKCMSDIGIECETMEIAADITQGALEESFHTMSENPLIHGILLFRPLPPHLDEEPLKALINPIKDVDGMSPVNIAKVFSGDDTGYAPCTAEAVMEILNYYNINPEGKKVTIIGRSMVVGKPLSMLLLNKNATITVCHTRTKNLAEACRNADILIAAAGKAGMVGSELVGRDAVVVDVGINVDASGKLCGDVDFASVREKAAFISPVPRGVGSVTTTVLAKHVICGAKASCTL